MHGSPPYRTAGSTLGQRGKMPRTLGRNFPRQGSLLAVVLGVLALAGPVAAGNLTITPALELRETFSDNIDLDPDGQDQSWLTTEIVPGITLRSESARVKAALNAFPIIRHQTAGSDEGVTIAGELAGLGTVEAFEDLFFIEAQASISQQILSSGLAATTANEETVQVYRLSPYLRSRFGGFAEGEARYRISQVLVGGPEGVGGTSDSTAQSFHLSLDSGADFTRLKWSVSALGSYEGRSDDDDVLRWDTDVEVAYAFNRSISVLAAAGFQVFDDGNAANDIENPTWRVGFRWRPGPRNGLRVTYGARDDSQSANLNFSYDITARSSITASYTEVLEKPQERLVPNVSFVELDPETNQFTDPQTGLPFDPNQSPFDIGNETSRIKTFRFGINGVRGRNTFGLNVAAQNEKTEPGGLEEDVISLGARFIRRLSPRLALNLFTGYERSEFDDGQEDDQYNVTAGLNYELYKNLRANLQYGYLLQKSNVDTSEFTENRVTVSLRMTF